MSQIHETHCALTYDQFDIKHQVSSKSHNGKVDFVWGYLSWAQVPQVLLLNLNTISVFQYSYLMIYLRNKMYHFHMFHMRQRVVWNRCGSYHCFGYHTSIHVCWKLSVFQKNVVNLQPILKTSNRTWLLKPSSPYW